MSAGNSKQKAQRIHAKRRAAERYDLDFTKEVRHAFAALIHNNKAKFLYRQSRRVTVLEVPYEHNRYKIVYDSLRHEIVTFLPEDHHELDNGICSS